MQRSRDLFSAHQFGTSQSLPNAFPIIVEATFQHSPAYAEANITTPDFPPTRQFSGFQPAEPFVPAVVLSNLDAELCDLAHAGTYEDKAMQLSKAESPPVPVSPDVILVDFSNRTESEQLIKSPELRSHRQTCLESQLI
jgi:hypothetical protein